MVFLVDKSVYIVIFVYAVGFSAFAAQYIIGDVLGIQITNFSGAPLKSNIQKSINLTNTNKIINDINTTNGFKLGVQNLPGFSLGGMAFDLFTLFTGLYIFNMLYLFGVPLVFVIPIAVLYVILLIRSIIGVIWHI